MEGVDPERRAFLKETAKKTAEVGAVVAGGTALSVIPTESAEAQEETPDKRLERFAMHLGRAIAMAHYDFRTAKNAWEEIKGAQPDSDKVHSVPDDVKEKAKQIIENLAAVKKYADSIMQKAESAMFDWADSKNLKLADEIEKNDNDELQALQGTQFSADMLVEQIRLLFKEIRFLTSDVGNKR